MPGPARELVRIDTRGSLDAALGYLDAAPRGVERARRRALRKLKTWAQRQILRAAAEASGASQRTLMALLRYRGTLTGTGALSIWVGTDPIAAHRLGAVRWNRRMRGARVGRRQYEHAWSWGDGSRTGTAVMRRTTSERVPIEVVREPIHEAVSARIEALIPEISARFEQLLVQELRYALMVEGAPK